MYTHIMSLRLYYLYNFQNLINQSIVLMATLDSKCNSEEKEMVCHLATLVMEAGMSLSTVAE